MRAWRGFHWSIAAARAAHREALFRGVGRAFWRIHYVGFEVGRRHNFQYFEIFRAFNLAMRDAGNLVDHIAFVDGTHTHPRIFELGPAVEDHDELKLAVVHVPVLHFVGFLLAVGFHDVGHVVPVGAVFNAKVAVLKNFAQSGRPVCFGRQVV